MKELLRTNDMVVLSRVLSLLEGADIPHIVLDSHMSILEGSLGVLPRRVMVDEGLMIHARILMAENGLAREVRDQ